MATQFSDLEELLEQSDSEAERSSASGHRVWRVAVLLGGLALVAAAVWSVGRSKVRSGSRGVVALEEISCFESGMFYADPIKMDGTERTVEFSADACQQRCQVMEDCAHFTFWPDGGCLLTGDISYPKAAPAKYAATLSGPKFCGAGDDDDDGEDDVVTPDADSSSSSGLVSPGSSGLVAAPESPEPAAPAALPTLPPVPAVPAVPAASTWGTAAESKPAIAAVAGVNGTTCSLYPACVAAGIKEGDCCPNADQVTLGCCNGFPKQVEEVKIMEGTECSLFPACVALNITAGACCPTADRVKLGCCESI